VRVVFKDFVEEVQVSPEEHGALPEPLRAVMVRFDEPLLPLFILVDVFDAFFRYLADVLTTHCGLSEARFWQLVARTIHAYEDDHPELQQAYERFDLFRAQFPCFCLNKYRLVYHGYAEVADNALETSPRFSGMLPNPIAAFRRV
jgi:siderophore synthetase component